MSTLSSVVANALHWDYALPRNAVTAEVEESWVILHGTVDQDYQKSSAEADVLRLTGVLGVRNEIVVRSAVSEQNIHALPGCVGQGA
jgi:osmotically-inducible protein OsmY